MNKIVFIAIFLLLSICLYASFRTDTSTPTTEIEYQRVNSILADKTRKCACCEKINIAKKRVQERLRKQKAAGTPRAEASETP